MYRLLIIFFLFIPVCTTAQDVRELNSQNRSADYYETIELYQQMAETFSEAEFINIGPTDAGQPLHFFVINKKEIFNPTDINRYLQSVILINNGIHPGEPDGIDASLRLAQDLLNGNRELPDNVVICIVPVFNVGGALKRGCCSRANQNGPEQYGFRGNARNLDLNRDFIKCDAANTRSLTRWMSLWDPDLFIDTHVSNGADYQYTMTLLSTQPDKLGGSLTSLLRDDMIPALYKDMKQRGHEMTPYVNTKKYGDDPRKGIYDYYESPRYASGFAALMGIPSFVTETHMLKPFPSRVDATEAFLISALDYMKKNGRKVSDTRRAWKKEFMAATELPVDYTCDTTVSIPITFKGYESYTEISEVTKLPQLYYDNTRPYTDTIRYHNTFIPAKKVRIPKQYIIPGAWSEVVERLKNFGVVVQQLDRDHRYEAGIRYITSYETTSKAYEGRYLHYDIGTELRTETVKFTRGDYVIQTAQPAVRLIVETLEPEAVDSYFAWGFFDSILQQKEWFSSYVFDGYAEELLNNDKALRDEFRKKKKDDPEFARDAFSQLYFLYQRSPLFETSLNRYPVGMIY